MVNNYPGLDDEPRSRDEAARPRGVPGNAPRLLTLALLFSATGTVIGTRLEPSFVLGLIGIFGTLLVLPFARRRRPLQVFLLCAVSTSEGMFLAPLLDTFLAQGMGGTIVGAAGATAGLTLLAGVYGYTTRRAFNGVGTVLFVGFGGTVIASLMAVFLRLPGLSVATSLALVNVLSFLQGAAKDTEPGSPAWPG